MLQYATGTPYVILYVNASPLFIIPPTMHNMISLMPYE